MPHINLKLTGQLTESDREQLEEFIHRSKRLFGTKLGAGGTGIKGNITWTNETGLSSSAQLPDEDKIVEFLAAFRFFYLHRERANFLRILRVLKSYANSDESRMGLNQVQKRWEDALFSGAMSIKINGEELSASKVLDLWFNVHYFHSDRRKQPALQNLNEIMSEDFSKFMLLNAIYECTKLIQVISAGLDPLPDEGAA